ncbi:MAG: hypothetical protein FD163_644 [Hyphomonadaceae bacterium]|nr:MAG: hypothetical protein FD128_1171 [Hyphomonadaceae bacterium]KAF0185976.1 MAG: hypothetical protein FD163_644 [Hyphomonadaceae bacterium]
MKVLYFNLPDGLSQACPHHHFAPIWSDMSWVDYEAVIVDTGIDSSEFMEQDTGTFHPSGGFWGTHNKYFMHIRKEVRNSIELGKIVVFILNRHLEIASSNGTINNNRKMTSFDSKFSKMRARTFREADFFPKIMRQSWSVCDDLFKIECKVEDENLLPLLRDKSGQAVVAGFQKFESGATAIFLPSIDYARVAGTNKFEEVFGLIEAFASEIGKNNLKSEAPEWTNANLLKSNGELEILQQIQIADKKIGELKLKRDVSVLKLSDFEDAKQLLYATGDELENAVLKALVLFGFSAERFVDAHREFDAVFSDGQVRFIGEVEGRDNNAIAIKKFDQLERNRRSDFNRDEVETKAKGVLFGNGFRLIEPTQRQEEFTTKCLTEAKNTDSALVRTRDLYLPYTYLLGNDDDNYKALCRNAIIETQGAIVEFPQIPTN